MRVRHVTPAVVLVVLPSMPPRLSLRLMLLLVVVGLPAVRLL